MPRQDWQRAALRRQHVHASVSYQSCQQDISNINEAILMQIGTSGPHGKGMK